jgi:hypothetical protein
VKTPPQLAPINILHMHASIPKQSTATNTVDSHNKQQQVTCIDSGIHAGQVQGAAMM